VELQMAGRGVWGRQMHEPWLIVTEFSSDELPTGVAARLRHVQSQVGKNYRHVVVNEGPRRGVRVRDRIRRAQSAAEMFDNSGSAIIIGLGSPPMLILARRLVARAPSVTVFDVCDSTILQLRARAKSLSPKLIAVGLWMLLLHLTAARRLALSYISERDIHRDRWLNRRRSVRLIRFAEPEVLRTLPPVGAVIDRIVVAGDLNSFHNRTGLSLLAEAIRTAGQVPPIELYGPEAPRFESDARIRYVGWAKSVEEIYAGNTAVFVSNVDGSGVPNKLLEAIAAARPVVVHRSLESLVRSYSRAHLYSDADSLAGVLESLMSGREVIADAT
jgi:glycosyltransferase involved in cell wall biosynthesis